MAQPPSVLLHLTDLHFGSDSGTSDRDGRTLALRSLLRTVSQLEHPWRPSLLCITGDIAYRGLDSEYRLADAWLRELLEALQIREDHVFLCPGNHDLDRTLVGTERPSTPAQADTLLSPPLAENITRPFRAFEDFSRGLKIPPYRVGEQQSYLTGIRDHANVRFLACNSAWFSHDDHDRGKLWIGLPLLRHFDARGELELTARAGADPRLVVALLHHPDDYFSEHELNAWGGRQNTRDYLFLRAHVVLAGHTHAEVRRPDRIAGGALRFTGGATYDAQHYANVFSLFQLLESRVVHRAFRYEPMSPDHEWRAGNNPSIFDFGVSPARGAGAASVPLQDVLNKQALDYLSRKWSTLADEPAPPGLPVLRWRPASKTSSQDAESRRQSSTVALLDAVLGSRSVFVVGDMGSGKSTALAQLATRWMERSYDHLAIVIPASVLAKADQSIQIAEVAWAHAQLDENALESCLARGNILVCVDGLDEVTRPQALRLLSAIDAALTERAGLQFVLAGRLIEISGLATGRWQVLEALPPTQREALQVLSSDATGALKAQSADSVKKDPASVLRVIWSSEPLRGLAGTPLGLRLLQRALGKQSATDDSSIAGILASLLVERLIGWDERDLKRSSTAAFEDAVPGSTERLDLYGRIVHDLWENPADPLLVQRIVDRHLPNASPSARADAVRFFELKHLISTASGELFPIWVFAEVAAGLGGALCLESAAETWVTQDVGRWRIFAYSLFFLRRKGRNDIVLITGGEFLAKYVSRPFAASALAHVVRESASEELARRYVQLLQTLGPRPLTGFPYDYVSPAPAIAAALRLAGEEGFVWFYQEYLDPRRPFQHWGSALIERVFEHWLAGNLPIHDRATRERLKVFAGTARKAKAHVISFLPTLSLAVPEVFTSRERYWFAIVRLSSSKFGILAEQVIRRGLLQDRQMVLELLLDDLKRGYDTSVRCATIWLEESTDLRAGISAVVRCLLLAQKNSLNLGGDQLAELIVERLGEAQMRALLRWHLADHDGRVSAAAAMRLITTGESRLGILGRPLLRGLSEGMLTLEAEPALEQLLEKHQGLALDWLVREMRLVPTKNEYGVSGRWLSLLLSLLSSDEDAPEVLRDCCHWFQGFVFARHADVVAKFRALLAGPLGAACRGVLREVINGDDLSARRGASLSLIATEPNGNMEAWDAFFEGVDAFPPDTEREWPTFVLGLPIDHVTLELIHAHFHRYPEPGQRFARLVLAAKDYFVDADDQQRVLRELFEESGPLELIHDLRRRLLHLSNAAPVLTALLRSSKQRVQIDAARALLEFHRCGLEPEHYALCMLFCAGNVGGAPTFLEGIQLVDESASARATLEAAVQKDPALRVFPLATYLAISDSRATWRDLLFNQFFGSRAARVPGVEADAVGALYLRIGELVPLLGARIGEAAMALLRDAEVRASPWDEARLWLAVLAHEFAAPAHELLVETLQSSRIHRREVAASVIARIGAAAPELPWSDAVGAVPSISPPHLSDLGVLRRDSSDLSAAHCAACIMCLAFPDDDEVKNLHGSLQPLFEVLVEFCRSGELLPDRMLLAHTSGLQRKDGDACRRHLDDLWQLICVELLCFADDARQVFRDGLVRRLDAEEQPLTAAAGLLSIGHILTPQQLEVVLGALVELRWGQEWGVSSQLAAWLPTLDRSVLEQFAPRFQAAVESASRLEMRDAGDGHVRGMRSLTLALGYLLTAGRLSDAAVKLFARGVSDMSQMNASAARSLELLQPLLEAIDRTLLVRLVRRAMQNAPMLRALFRFAQLLVDAGELDDRRDDGPTV